MKHMRAAWVQAVVPTVKKSRPDEGLPIMAEVGGVGKCRRREANGKDAAMGPRLIG